LLFKLKRVYVMMCLTTYYVIHMLFRRACVKRASSFKRSAGSYFDNSPADSATGGVHTRVGAGCELPSINRGVVLPGWVFASTGAERSCRAFTRAILYTQQLCWGRRDAIAIIRSQWSVHSIQNLLVDSCTVSDVLFFHRAFSLSRWGLNPIKL